MPDRADTEKSALERRLASQIAVEFARTSHTTVVDVAARIAAEEIEKARNEGFREGYGETLPDRITVARKVRDWCLEWIMARRRDCGCADWIAGSMAEESKNPLYLFRIIGADGHEGGGEVSEPADHGVDRTIGLTGARKESRASSP